MKPLMFMALLFVAISANAKDEKPRINYVGEGRYACSGSAAQCAHVESNNRQLEELRRFEQERNEDRRKRSEYDYQQKEKEFRYGK